MNTNLHNALFKAIKYVVIKNCHFLLKTIITLILVSVGTLFLLAHRVDRKHKLYNPESNMKCYFACT